MQSDNGENPRSLDQLLASQEVLEAGFEFVDFADLHYRPDNGPVFEIGRKTVTRNAGSATRMFRKPQPQMTGCSGFGPDCAGPSS